MNQLYTMESAAGIGRMDDETVHLVVTSPPYNCGMPYDEWDDTLDWQTYEDTIIRAVFRQVYRVLVPGGRVAINLPEVVQDASSKNRRCVFLPSLYQQILVDELGYLPRDVITWAKQPADPLTGFPDEEKFCGKNTKWGSWKSPRNPCIRSFAERVIVFSKDHIHLEGDETDITAEEFKLFTRNIWPIPTNSEKGHPAVFPIELPHRLIKLYSFIGQVVLDPFAGLGTTLIAARRLGRRWIGFEISEEYSRKARVELSKQVEILKPTTQYRLELPKQEVLF